MSNLHSLVSQACQYGLVGGDCYSALRAVTVQRLAEENEADNKERSELISAIIRISDNIPSESSNRWEWERFRIAVSKAESLVDSIPHFVRYAPTRAKRWQDLEEEEFNGLKACGMLWEFYPDAPTHFPAK